MFLKPELVGFLAFLTFLSTNDRIIGDFVGDNILTKKLIYNKLYLFKVSVSIFSYTKIPFFCSTN